MSNNAFNSYGQDVILHRPDSEKLASIPGEPGEFGWDFNGNDFTMNEATDGNLFGPVSTATDTLKPPPVSRDSFFAEFYQQNPEQEQQHTHAYPDVANPQGQDASPYAYSFAPYDHANNAFTDHNLSSGSTTDKSVIDPRLFHGTHQQNDFQLPKVRTNSGEFLTAIPGPEGIWLHPKTYRQLDQYELRYDNNDSTPAMVHPDQSQVMQSVYPTPPLEHVEATPYSFNAQPLPVADADLYSYGPIFENEISQDSFEPQRKRRKSSRTSSATEVMTAAEKLKRRQPMYDNEAPKADKARPWVRVNSATKGNTRTGKTNNYGDGPYRQTIHPLGPTPCWTASDGSNFRYNQWGELQGVSFKASQLKRFLYEHPFHKNGGPKTSPRKLIIWIQKMPGDSAKRVNTQHGLKCRVAECPAGIYKTRTINTGHHRVAFDEQWATHGDTRNPMHVAGYAHLYCMERFFDFKAICRDLDVRVDDRELTGEPTGEWVAGLGQGTEENRITKEFITMAKTGKHTERWSEYPAHNPARSGARKLPHKNTLVHRLVEKKADATGHSKMRMMMNRGRSATQFFVNMGDLQLQVDTQQARNAAKSKKEKGRQTQKRKMRAEDEDSDDIEDEVDFDIPNYDRDDDPEDDYRPRPQPGTGRTSSGVRITRNSSSSAHVSQTTAEAALSNAFSAPVANMGIGSNFTMRTATRRQGLAPACEEDLISPKSLPN